MKNGKFLSIFIVIALMASLIPINVFADENSLPDMVYCTNSTYTRECTIGGNDYIINFTLLTIDIKRGRYTGRFEVGGDEYYSEELSEIILSHSNDYKQIRIPMITNWHSRDYIIELNDNNGVFEEKMNNFFGTSYSTDFIGPPGAVTRAIKNSNNGLDTSLYLKCRDYMARVYKSNDFNSPESLTNKLNSTQYTDIVCNYFGDSRDNNISYVIAHKNTTTQGVECLVILRGTDGIEWEGNMNICPPDSQGNYDVYNGQNWNGTHDNFQHAANDMEDLLKEYLDFCNINNENTKVVITGHSRGAAVSNLLAKTLSDESDFLPEITAYTFATPNVAPYDETMECYPNIFNFCKNKDFITCIPLSNYNWNYWKYGKTYIENSLDNDVYCDKITRIMSSDDYAPNVEEYYTKKFKSNYNSEIEISLYDFMKMCLSVPMSSDDGYLIKLKSSKGLFEISQTAYKGLAPLSKEMEKNLAYIFGNHWQKLYKLLYITDFKPFTIYDAKARAGEVIINNDNRSNTINSNQLNLYPNTLNSLNSNNLSEILQLKQFLNCEDNNYVSNADKLGWDIDDETTWDGITFNLSGNISSIDLEFEDLYGTLNLSNFADLQYVNVSSNWITSVNVSGCTSLTHLDVLDNELASLNVSDNTALTYLDCSYNDIGTVDVSYNTNLETFNCNNCGLTTIDVSDLEELIELDCGNNNLSTLDISNNDELLKLYCILNHLDLTDSQLISDFETVEARVGSEAVFEPQYLPFNAVYNNDETSAIMSFALSNPQLDLLDENDNLLRDNVQNYCEFEKINGTYRVIGIDISECEIEGTLDLSAFPYLRYFYCYGNEITGLNLYSCTSLQELDCTSCQITNLVLPSNASDTLSELNSVNCENNHIDTNIFTTQIINNISSKSDYELNYKHQIIDAPVADFNQSDYEAMCDLANYGNNLDVLNWDLTNPGEWNEVNWIYNSTTQKYELLEVYFDCLNISGDIDISSCTGLSNYSFSGTDITCARLPGGTVPEYAFYDCSQLESVYLASDTDEIEDSAFYYCDSLTDVYYFNTALNWENVTIGDDNDSLEDADIHFTDDNPHTHFWDKGVVTTEPTCSTLGVKTYTCELCNQTSTEDIPTLEHTPAETTAVAPTCTETGLTEGTHCSVCNAVLTAQEIVPALGHDYVVVTTQPTCTEQGYTTHTCSRCDDSYVDTYVDALGHTVVIDELVAPTCTETGLTEGTHCSVCNAVLTDQEVVPALGHTVVIDELVAPTCTETGLTVGTHCSVCNAVLTAQDVVPALGHDYVAVATQPTCTEQGYTTHTCSRCDDSYVDTYVDALGHTWGEWVSDNNATLNADGTKTRTCSVCNDTETITEPRNGWYQFGTSYWYYFVNGVMQTGWKNLQHNSQNYSWYYFDPSNGRMVTGWKQINSNWYYFDSNGARQTGWKQINGNWYYFDSNGIRQTGWKQINGNWYYFNSNGIRQTGWVQDDGKWYYLNSNGVMQTGWVQDNGNWYYLNSHGVMQTGWVQDNGNWYYLNSHGVMQTGWVQVNGNWFYLNSHGVMQTGWVKVGNYWYYMNSYGVMQTGWLRDNGNWYYLKPENGRMVTGTYVINGSTYYFDSHGVCQNPYNPQGLPGGDAPMGTNPLEG